MSTRKTTAERIEAAKQEKSQMEAEIKRLLNLQKAEERKRRGHRISKRGAHLESLLPDTIMLSDARFFTFLERTVANKFGRDILDKLIAEQQREDATNSAVDAADAGGVPADTATVAAAQGGKTAASQSTAPKRIDSDSDADNPAQTSATPNGADGGRTGGDGATQGA